MLQCVRNFCDCACVISVFEPDWAFMKFAATKPEPTSEVSSSACGRPRKWPTSWAKVLPLLNLSPLRETTGDRRFLSISFGHLPGRGDHPSLSGMLATTNRSTASLGTAHSSGRDWTSAKSRMMCSPLELALLMECRLTVPTVGPSGAKIDVMIAIESLTCCRCAAVNLSTPTAITLMSKCGAMLVLPRRGAQPGWARPSAVITGCHAEVAPHTSSGLLVRTEHRRDTLEAGRRFARHEEQLASAGSHDVTRSIQQRRARTWKSLRACSTQRTRSLQRCKSRCRFFPGCRLSTSGCATTVLS